MYSAEQIRKIEIKRATFSGYNMDDVDNILDNAADSIELLQKEKADAEARAAALAEKLEMYSTSESSIHSAIINAQRLADQTVKEASESAGHTISDANMKAETTLKDAEEKAAAILAEAEEKANYIVNDAIAKTECMIAAAHDSVARQQMMFDKIKLETKELKELVLQKYNRQITFLEQLPDEVPFDAERAAEVMAFSYDKVPDYDEMAAAARPGKAAETAAVTAEPEADLHDDLIAAVQDEAEETDYAKILSDAVAAKKAKDAEEQTVGASSFVVNLDAADELE